MKRLESVIILIRIGAIGVYSMAALTLRGAWSQLKICADQTACPRHARLSPEPPPLQRDGQAQGLLLRPNKLRRTQQNCGRRSPLRDLVQASAAPFSYILKRMSGSTRRNPSARSQTSVRKCHTPHLIPRRDPSLPSGNRLGPILAHTLSGNVTLNLNDVTIRSDN